MYIWGLNVKKITNIIPHFNILHEAEVSKELGAVHKRRQQLGGGKGWKIGQNCWRILLKNCQYGERGVKKFRKIANVVYGWSLREMIRTSNAQIREQVCLDTFPIWIFNHGQFWAVAAAEKKMCSVCIENLHYIKVTKIFQKPLKKYYRLQVFSYCCENNVWGIFPSPCGPGIKKLQTSGLAVLLSHIKPFELEMRRHFYFVPLYNILLTSCILI